MAEPRDDDFEFELELAKAKAAARQRQQAAAAPPVPAPAAPTEPQSALGAVARSVGSALTPDFTPEGRAGTVTRGFGSGASLGFADELRGVAGAMQEAGSRGLLGRLASAALSTTGPGALASLGAAPQVAAGTPEVLGENPDLPALEAIVRRYRADRDRARVEQARATAANPKLSTASQIAGALVVPAPKLGAAATVGTAAKTGALLGGGAAAGGTEADLTRGEFGQAARDVAMGVGAGGALGAVVPPLTAAAGRVLRPVLDRFANRQAVKAVLPNATLSNPLRDKLRVKTDADVQELGQEIRQSGILGSVIPRSAVAAKEANEAALAEAGAAIGERLQQADDAVAAGMASGQPTWNRPDVGAVRGAFDEAVQQASQRTGTAAMAAPEVLAKGEAFIQPNVSSWRRVWDTKATMGDQAFSREATSLNEKIGMLQQGQQGAAREIERQLEQQIGPDEMAALKAAMQRYHLGKRIEDTLGTKADRMLTAPPIGPLELQAMQTAGISQLPGLAGAAALRWARGRAFAAAALYAPRVARGVGELGRGVTPLLSQTVGDAAAVKSVADPLGPLRQYLGLPPEERSQASSDVFNSEGGF